MDWLVHGSPRASESAGGSPNWSQGWVSQQVGRVNWPLTAMLRLNSLEKVWPTGTPNTVKKFKLKTKQEEVRPRLTFKTIFTTSRLAVWRSSGARRRTKGVSVHLYHFADHSGVVPRAGLVWRLMLQQFVIPVLLNRPHFCTEAISIKC